MKSKYMDPSYYHGRDEYELDPILARDFLLALAWIEEGERKLTEITSKLSDTGYLSAQMMSKVREALREVKEFGKEVLVIKIAEPGERRRARKDG